MIFLTKKIKRHNQGYVLMTSIFVVILLLLMGGYYLNFALSEYRIAKSQTVGVQDYYLAEAGVHEMIWQLKNNEDWKDSFETDPNWSEEFTRNNDLVPGGSYTVSVQNSDLAQGEIISTGTMVVQGQISQRVIKTTVYKAIGENPTEDLAVYDNGNIDFTASSVNVYNGGLFSNNNVLVKLLSTIDVNKKVEAVNHVDVHFGSTVNAGEGIFDSDSTPPTPEAKPQPAVDFDSEDPNSLKNLAIAQDHLFTEKEFEDFLDDNPVVVLDSGVYYVTGKIEIKRNMHVTLNGILAADQSIDVGTSWKPIGGEGAKLTINHTTGEPSGLMSKHKIDFGAYTNLININGLLYSLEEIRMVSLPKRFDILGGFYSRKLQTISVWEDLNITYDSETVNSAIGTPPASPTIYVDHWEEEY